MNSPSLNDLYSFHIGKVSDKWKFYLDTYDQTFLAKRNEAIALLEIGIQNGGSLEIWTAYFKNAKILVGCDINPKCIDLKYENPKIEIVIGNANEDQCQIEILKKSAQFDLIIDDGSHRSADIIESFSRYFPYLSSGGMYVVEDLHCSYWNSFGGGLFHPSSSISFFKRLADVLNFEHWGVPSKRQDILKSFFDEYNCAINGVDLANIHSIEFLNSICIIRKKISQENELGPRIIAGTDAQVVPEVLALQGRLASGGVEIIGDAADRTLSDLQKRLKLVDETRNSWSQMPPLPEELYRQMAAEVERTAEFDQIKKEAERFKAKHADTLKALDFARTAGAKAQRKIAVLQHERKSIESALQNALQIATLHQQTADALYASTSWRATAPLRRATQWWARQKDRALTLGYALLPGGGAQRQRIRQAIERRVNRQLRQPALTPGNQIENYGEWVRLFGSLSKLDHDLIKNHIEQVALPESVIFWIFENANAPAIEAACISLKAQLHSKWRCTILIDDARDTHVLTEIVRNDSRISLRPILSAEEISGLEDTSALIIRGAGVLADHATYLFSVASADAFHHAYSDYDLLGEDDSRHSPKFFPNSDRGFLTSSPLALVTLSAALIQAISAKERLDATIAAEIKNQFQKQQQKTTHIPFILFHAAKEISAPQAPAFDRNWNTEASLPSISIIIPTRDRLDFLQPCVDSILKNTNYDRDRYEIIVVDNGSTEEDLLHYLDLLSREKEITLIRDPSKFNYSRLNNEAAKIAKGELLAFVNNDIVVHDALWLSKLAFHARQHDVGAVGAKLLYPDMTVQHGGVVLGIQGVAAHAHHNLAAVDPGYLGLNNTTHDLSAVTGACLMVRREIFDKVNGFDENLAVAFNDVLLCLDIAEKGYRNVFVADPLLIHFESKTRGFDDTQEKQQLFRKEARYARSRHQARFKADPYYNENLSLEKVYELAFPPRAEKPWQRFRRESSGKLSILMLSSTHQVGHGVAVVVDLQAKHLAAQGHKVFLGGPLSAREFPYTDCQRVYLDGPKEAATFAMQYGIDCVVMHTPPFYSTVRWLGTGVKTIAYDYGEPDPDFFPEADERRNQLFEKAFCLEMTDEIYAISDAVKNESSHERVGVIPLGNSHLATWNDALRERRAQIRASRQWDDKVIILNVCRFHEGERNYKGIDEYCLLQEQLRGGFSASMPPVVFCLAGKGSEEDVADMQARGLSVFPNVSDEELIDLYCAADIYVNFSKWEGYNLGIGQALAMGLPVVASDIPAHRAFKIFTTNDLTQAAEKLLEIAGQLSGQRVAILSSWDEPLKQFTTIIDSLCRIKNPI
jgi:GT2 family glycosyltransferase